MNVSIPPVVFYVIGAMLVVFGTLRAYHFGWKKRRHAADEGEVLRSPEQKRHIMWGIIWVIMGLFLVASTLNASIR